MKALKQNFSVFFIMLTLFIFLGETSFLFSKPQQKKTDEIMGAIAGVITYIDNLDQENYPLPGATVEATRPDVRSKVIDITDGMGHFQLSNLLPGTYTVTFSCAGFKTVKREGIIVQSGSTFDLNETMTMVHIEEPIVVFEEPTSDQEPWETWKCVKNNEAYFAELSTVKLSITIATLIRKIKTLEALIHNLQKSVDNLDERLKVIEEKIK